MELARAVLLSAVLVHIFGQASSFLGFIGIESKLKILGKKQFLSFGDTLKLTCKIESQDIPAQDVYFFVSTGRVRYNISSGYLKVLNNSFVQFEAPIYRNNSILQEQNLNTSIFYKPTRQFFCAYREFESPIHVLFESPLSEVKFRKPVWRRYEFSLNISWDLNQNYFKNEDGSLHTVDVSAYFSPLVPVNLTGSPMKCSQNHTDYCFIQPFTGSSVVYMAVVVQYNEKLKTAYDVRTSVFSRTTEFNFKTDLHVQLEKPEILDSNQSSRCVSLSVKRISYVATIASVQYWIFLESIPSYSPDVPNVLKKTVVDGPVKGNVEMKVCGLHPDASYQMSVKVIPYIGAPQGTLSEASSSRFVKTEIEKEKATARTNPLMKISVALLSTSMLGSILFQN